MKKNNLIIFFILIALSVLFLILGIIDILKYSGVISVSTTIGTLTPYLITATINLILFVILGVISIILIFFNRRKNNNLNVKNQ